MKDTRRTDKGFAFAHARFCLQAFRIPGPVLQYRPLNEIMEILYRIFLIIMPLLQELARRVRRETMVLEVRSAPRRRRC